MLSKGWIDILREHGVDEFHATRFFGRSNGRRVGEYADWSDDRARSYVRRLAELIDQARITPVGCGVERAAFDGLSVGERRFLTGANFRDFRNAGKWKGRTGAPTKPYFFLFHFLVLQTLALSSAGALVHYIFDEQKEFQRHADGMYQAAKIEVHLDYRQRLGDLTFADSRKHPGLQVADMYSHLVYSLFSRPRGLDREREGVLGILTRKHHGFPVFDEKTIRLSLDGASIPEGVLERMKTAF